MVTATWNGTVIAQSDNTVVVEGNHYFPPDSVNKDYLVESATSTRCPWKGTASYYTLEADGKTQKDAAWYYATPSEAAAEIKGHVAFTRDVEVS